MYLPALDAMMKNQTQQIQILTFSIYDKLDFY